jgi:hypothetical protein
MSDLLLEFSDLWLETRTSDVAKPSLITDAFEYIFQQSDAALNGIETTGAYRWEGSNM